jgi:ABC-type glycerol-3-phosphate transport system substrate-binding protein
LTHQNIKPPNLSFWGYYISKAARNPQGCWEWIKFLSGQPTIFSGIPARQSVANSPTWEAQVGKNLAEVYRLALEHELTQRYELSTSQSSSVWAIGRLLGNAVDAVLAEGKEPQSVLSETQKKAEAFLSCMVIVDNEKLKGMNLTEKAVECLARAEAGRQ